MTINYLIGHRPTLFDNMKNSVKRLLALLGLAAMALSSCNTMAGFGRDMQSAGEAIHNKAQE
jgi:predicted small secreted protein